MKTAMERRKDLRDDLQLLLNKHKAVVSSDHDDDGSFITVSLSWHELEEGVHRPKKL